MNAPHRKDQEECLEELRNLAALVAEEPGLEVVLGEGHDANWSFDWRNLRITVNPADLLLRSHEFSLGLILHEAAHARLTRLPHIVPTALLASPAVRHLLNVIEDCRIEGWLQRRLPGARAWIKEYNDVLFRSMLQLSSEVQNRDPGGAFLNAILCRWWYGRDPEHLPEVAANSLNKVWDRIEAAIAAAPPPDCRNLEETRLLYQAHIASSCYRTADLAAGPSSLEMLARMSQHESWTIILGDILPEFQRLLEETGSPLGQMADQLAQVLAMGAPDATANPAAGRRGTVPGGLLPPSLRGLRRRIDGNRAGSRSNSGASAGGQAYHQAKDRLAQAIEEIGDSLLRHLVAETRSRTRRGYPSGQQLDLRSAMQFEADPTGYERLWMRQSRPTRPDPSFFVLTDASGSMEGARAHATFDALVILREVCLRLEIPLTILLFANEATVLQHWTQPDLTRVIDGLCKFRAGRTEAPT